MASLTTHFLTRPDGRVAFDDAGHGPLVVLVPGIVSRRPWVHATQVVVLMLLFSFALTEIGRPISE